MGVYVKYLKQLVQTLILTGIIAGSFGILGCMTSREENNVSNNFDPGLYGVWYTDLDTLSKFMEVVHFSENGEAMDSSCFYKKLSQNGTAIWKFDYATPSNSSYTVRSGMIDIIVGEGTSAHELWQRYLIRSDTLLVSEGWLCEGTSRVLQGKWKLANQTKNGNGNSIVVYIDIRNNGTLVWTNNGAVYDSSAYVQTSDSTFTVYDATTHNIKAEIKYEIKDGLFLSYYSQFKLFHRTFFLPPAL